MQAIAQRQHNGAVFGALVLSVVALWALFNVLTVAQAASLGNTYRVGGTTDGIGICTLGLGGYTCPTLRAAVIAANANPGSTIQLSHGVTYTLTVAPSGSNDASTGDLNLTADVTFGFVPGVCLSNCQATIQGDANWADRLVYVQSGAHVSLFAVTFRNGHAPDNGGAIWNVGVLTLTNCLVTGNSANYFGGGIYTVQALYLNGTTFRFNTAGVQGGGLYNDRGWVSVVNTTLDQNSATYSGGGAYSTGGTWHTLSSTLSNNITPGQGGGFAGNGTIYLTATRLTGNQAASGGGLYLTNASAVLASATLSANIVTVDGGGVYLSNAALTLADSLLQNNTASHGAGLFAESPSSVTVNNTRILTNEVTGSGGGLWNGGQLTLNTGSVIQGNRANDNGGGLMNYGVATLTNATVAGNLAQCNVSYTARGGGLFNAHTLVVNTSILTGNFACDGGGLFNAGTFNGQGNTFTHNLAYYNGGGLYVAVQSTAQLSDSTLISNTVHTSGGGLMNFGDTTLTRLKVIDNYASDSGGGLDNWGSLAVSHSALYSNTAKTGGGLNNNGVGTLTLANSTLSGNAANYTGGLYGSGGQITLNNVTIAQNSGGGVSGWNNVHFANTLLAGNPGGDCGSNGYFVSHGYNLIQDATECVISGDTTGNLIGVNPLLGPLQANGGSTWTHALLSGSPAINKANPAAADGLGYHCAATDQRGAARPVGGRCDIGAYEAGGLPNHLYLPLVRR